MKRSAVKATAILALAAGSGPGALSPGSNSVSGERRPFGSAPIVSGGNATDGRWSSEAVRCMLEQGGFEAQVAANPEVLLADAGELARPEDARYEELLVRACQWAATGEVRPDLGGGAADLASIAVAGDPRPPATTRGAGTLGPAPTLVLDPQATGNSTVAEERPAKVIELFNGRDLTGWTYVPGIPFRKVEKCFVVDREGNLVCKGNPLGYLKTQALFSSFLLELEYRFPPLTHQTGDGGVLVRVHGKDVVWPRCMEVQLQALQAGDLWTYQGFGIERARYRTKGQVTRKLAFAERRAGEWNRLEVRLQGDHLRVVLNGQLVNELRGVEQVPGAIAIAAQYFELHYRNIRLTPLD